MAAAVTACTADPAPEPSPPPPAEEATEPAPSGVRVAVVLPAAATARAAAFLDAAGELAQLAEEPGGDVASVRTVVPDTPEFVPDIAALLAEEGADLVCVLGEDGAPVVAELADRFPATRFCAIGRARDGQPGNLDLIEVAQEELGHVLGVAVGAVAGDDPAGVVLGDDGTEADRRRAGARAALTGSQLAVDAVVADATAVTELVDALDGIGLASVLVDLADPVLATAVAATAPTWVGPRGVPIDASAGSAIVRWSLRADVLVGTSVGRLLGVEEAAEVTVLGFGQDAFTLTFSDAVPSSVRAATEAAAEELATGTRDPLEPPTGDDPDAEEVAAARPR